MFLAYYTLLNKIMDEPDNFRYFSRGVLIQFLTALAASLSGISDGMQYGWSSPVLPILRADTNLKMSQEDETWIEAIYLLAGLLALPLTIYLVDKIGRQKSILLASVTSLIAWIILAHPPNVLAIYVARFLTGAAADVAFVATPMYIAEISHEKCRGLLTLLVYILMLLGVVIIYSLAPFVPLYVPSLVAGGLILIQLIILPFMTESPNYLLMNGKNEEARKSLAILRGEFNETEFDNLVKAVVRQGAEPGRLKDMFLIKSNRTAFIITLVLVFCQQFAGLSVMVMSFHPLLQSVGATFLDENYEGILFSALMFLAGTLCALYVDRFGRRPLLISSSILSGICLLILGIYFHLKYADVNLDKVHWIPLTCILVHAVSLKLGLGLVPQIITAELFSNNFKAKGLTFADGIFAAAGSLSIVVYQYLSDAFGTHIPMYIFTIICFFSAGFTVFVVPETKGRTLEEIQCLLKSGDSIRTYT